MRVSCSVADGVSVARLSSLTRWRVVLSRAIDPVGHHHYKVNSEDYRMNCNSFGNSLRFLLDGWSSFGPLIRHDLRRVPRCSLALLCKHMIGTDCGPAAADIDGIN
jgi:hypothetical protein